MPKAFLFDADGVVIKRQDEYFSVKFAREYGAPLDEVTEFFKTTFRECQEGKADLKDELARLLPKWGWEQGTDSFLEYWFADTEIDPEVMQRVAEYRKKGIKCILVTDQDNYRAAYLRERLGLGQQFDSCFFSYELGVSKSQPAFFEQVLQRLNLPAAEVSYRDDDKKNVEVARSLGINTRLYKGLSDLEWEQNEPKIPRI